METSKNETGGAWQALSNELEGAAERVGASVVAVNGRHRIASSGVCWRAGVVVTTAHTIKREDELSVTLPGGAHASATLVGRDGGTDLAVLKLEGVELQPAATADASTLKVGQLVLAVGRSGAGGLGASFGIVGAVGGAWRTWRGGEIEQLVRLGLPLYPGLSGGALVDAGGRVVGINTSGLSRGAGLVIPTATVNRVVEQLLEKGRIPRGYLGVALHPVHLADALRNRLNLPDKTGLVVLSVEPEGPADKAGLLVGDIIYGVGSSSAGDTDDLQSALGSKSVGQPLNLRLIRGGELAEVTITVGERPRRKC